LGVSYEQLSKKSDCESNLPDSMNSL